jgi:hypothetical protein
MFRPIRGGRFLFFDLSTDLPHLTARLSMAKETECCQHLSYLP